MPHYVEFLIIEVAQQFENARFVTMRAFDSWFKAQTNLILKLTNKVKHDSVPETGPV